jgi:short-subunit dehydrogenase
MENRIKIVIVGATSGIAQQCARQWVTTSPVDLTLVGRNPEKLQQTAQDLRVRCPASTIETVVSDFSDAAAIQQTADAICQAAPVDVVLIAHGSLPSQPECQDNLSECRQALEINGVSPVLFAEAFVAHMVRANKGTLAIIGSVAGDRGRKSNYVYGSAKALVASYAQGLQHRLAGTSVKVVLVKPGPTDTPMTAHLKAQGARLASAAQVAGEVIKAIGTGRPVVYTPAKWALIMAVIRNMPSFVFNKLNI